jgi:hypothetical protein
VLPSFPKLGNLMASGVRKLRVAEIDRLPLLSDRLTELKELCSAQGATLIIWVPPVPGRDAYAKLIQQAGAKVGVPVIPAATPRRWEMSDFLDGYHLNAKAAKTFTVSFANELQPFILHPKLAQDGTNALHLP